jgi:hypothetical protein
MLHQNLSNNGNTYMGQDAEKVALGIPLGAFSLQLLYSSNVYRLGLIEVHSGVTDSCKTALLFEKFRWFIANQGKAFYGLNESRDPAELRTSIIGKENLVPSKFTMRGPYSTLEEWQVDLTTIIKSHQARYSLDGNSTFPLITGIDSITGTTNTKTVEGIMEKGHATLGFAQDANLINTYLKTIAPKVSPWPISLIFNSHIRYEVDKYGNRKEKIPGGLAVVYGMTYHSMMSKSTKEFNRAGAAGGYRITIKMAKVAGTPRQIDVDYLWYHDEGNSQTTIWDWHGASMENLAVLGKNPKYKALKDIINITSVHGDKTTCPTLGYNKPALSSEVGATLMQDEKILTQLQDFFGIKRRPVFVPGKSFREQKEEALRAGFSAEGDGED